MSGGREFAVAKPRFGADSGRAADLADRSAFTREQIRGMSPRERELLDKTLAEQADDDGGDSGTDDVESLLKEVKALREEVETLRNERQEARETVAADEELTRLVGALTASPKDEPEDPGVPGVGPIATLLEEAEERLEGAEMQGGAPTTLSARETARARGEADGGTDGADDAASAYRESVGALSGRESDESGDTE